jgi:uncharacterized membrane protein
MVNFWGIFGSICVVAGLYMERKFFKDREPTGTALVGLVLLVLGLILIIMAKSSSPF